MQVMALMFTTIGSAADYGRFGRWLLLVVTVVCWAAQYACMALTRACTPLSLAPHSLTATGGPDRWGLAMALYVVGFISYGATLVFYAAVFPRLARNTTHARSLRQKLRDGQISREEYEVEESMEKNRISNISTVCVVLWDFLLGGHVVLMHEAGA